jgi:WD40 repeat protein
MTLGGKHGRIASVVFAPDGNALLSGTSDGTVRSWELDAGKERTEFKLTPELPIKFSNASLAVSGDGKTLVAGVSRQGGTRQLGAELVVWDVETSRELATMKKLHTTHPCVAFLPDGKTVASTNDGMVELWDTTDGAESRLLKTQVPGGLDGLAVSPNGKFVASGFFRSDPSSKQHFVQVVVWDLATGDQVAALTGHNGSIYSLAFTPDGHTLASASEDGTVKLWDVATAKERTTLRGHQGRVFAVAVSPDGSTLASGGEDRCVQLWDLRTVLRINPTR